VKGNEERKNLNVKKPLRSEGGEEGNLNVS